MPCSSSSSPTSDATDTSSLPSGVQIPSVLQSMCEDGARFCPATHCWAIASDGNIRVNREFSSSFSLNAQVSSVDVLEAFYRVGVGPEHVTCVQFNSSNHLWTVSFKDREGKYQITGLHQILVKGHQCFMSDCDNRTVIVKIFDAPNEMPDYVLVGRLSVYGKVFSFLRDKCHGHINNGVRTARMCLSLEVPSVVRISGCYVRLWYPVRPKHAIVLDPRIILLQHADPHIPLIESSQVILLKTDVANTVASEQPASYAASVTTPRRLENIAVPPTPGSDAISKPNQPEKTTDSTTKSNRPSKTTDRSRKSTESSHTEEPAKTQDQAEKRRPSDLLGS